MERTVQTNEPDGCFEPQEYTPVDTSYEAREQWPHHYLTEDQLNGRELGQFIAGFLWGEAMSGKRAWKITVPDDKLAAVVAALVDRGNTVSREWGEATPRDATTILVWNGI